MIKRVIGRLSSRNAGSGKRPDEIELLHKSPIVDPVWYRRTYLDLEATPIDVARHYLEHGAAEGRNPGPHFDTEFYLEQNPDVAASGINPLIHYLLWGAKEGRDPYRLVRANGQQTEAIERSLPSPSAASPHSDHKPREASQKTTPLQDAAPKNLTVNAREEDHALPQAMPVFEWRKCVEQSGFFDADWYLRKYRDVGRAGIDPLDHFIQFGSAEHRNPGPKFNARWYVEEYPDSVTVGLEPLAHYLTIGREKGYQANGTDYKRWCQKFDTLTNEDLSIIRHDISSGAFPSLYVIVYFQRSAQSFVINTVKTLSDQLFDRWQAVFIFEHRCDLREIETARRAIEGKSRFFIVSEAYTSSSLPQGSKGERFVFISAGVLIREHALYMVASAAAASDVSLVYSDEDTLDENGDRKEPIFKPQYSPELARTTKYFGSFVLVRGFENTLEHVLKGAVTVDSLIAEVLRFSDSRTIRHIPSILYHDIMAPRREIEIPIELVSSDELLPGFTIIIPTRDRLELLEPCIASIEERSEYPREKIEIIVVDNGSTDEKTLNYLALLAREGRARIIRDAGKFNFSRLNNLAAAEASREVLLFLNNDTVVEDPFWLRRIATYVVQKDVGAVGGKLLYPDHTIQHGGVVLGVQGVAAHDLAGVAEGEVKVRMNATREVSAVTGACLAMRREVFDEIGGFDTVLAVAFNDTLLCIEALKAGYRNICIKKPLLIHFESKSRGYDDSAERVALFRREARYVRQRHNDLFRNDPYYNPNLCLQQVNELAFPPRSSKPWRIRRRNLAKLKILILSSTAEIGHGVAVVINLQAAHLVAAGHEVYIGGPKGKIEFEFSGCRRVYLDAAAEAAAFAVECGIDCIVVETPPFFSIVRWLGDWPRTLFLDHGEPPAEYFPDADARRSIVAEKQLCFTMASKVFAISPSVRAEGGEERAEIIPNGNSHLVVWHESLRALRGRVRAARGWESKAVVLNVCRFEVGERLYKGLDKYAEVLQEFRFTRPKLAAQTTFVLCGKATECDVAAMKDIGFEVFANVTDAELIDLYIAADIYANFSRWEGYNLGIGQALALGLPAVASDIPAHRAFSIFTSNDTLPIVEKLSDFIETTINGEFSCKRDPIVTDWKSSLMRLEYAITKLCRDDEGAGRLQ